MLRVKLRVSSIFCSRLKSPIFFAFEVLCDIYNPWRMNHGVDIFLWRTIRLLDCFQHQLCCLLACKWGISMLNYNSEYANYLPTISERLCANAFTLTEPEMRLCVLVFVWCGKGYYIRTKKYSIHSLILWFHALYWYIVSVKVESKQLCSHLFKKREREKTEHRISLI